MNQNSFTKMICELNGLDPKFYPEKAILEGQRII